MAIACTIASGGQLNVWTTMLATARTFTCTSAFVPRCWEHFQMVWCCDKRREEGRQEWGRQREGEREMLLSNIISQLVNSLRIITKHQALSQKQFQAPQKLQQRGMHHAELYNYSEMTTWLYYTRGAMVVILETFWYTCRRSLKAESWRKMSVLLLPHCSPCRVQWHGHFRLVWLCISASLSADSNLSS